MSDSLSSVDFQGGIGLNAAHMVMELVKDNRKILDRITHKEIDMFVDLLKTIKVCMKVFYSITIVIVHVRCRWKRY